MGEGRRPFPPWSDCYISSNLAKLGSSIPTASDISFFYSTSRRDCLCIRNCHLELPAICILLRLAPQASGLKSRQPEREIESFIPTESAVW